MLGLRKVQVFSVALRDGDVESTMLWMLAWEILL